MHSVDIMQAASALEQLGYEVLQVKPTHNWLVADKDGFVNGWVAAKNIDFPVVKIEDLENAVVKENRIELGEWFILVDLGLSQVKVTHKTDGRNWVSYSIEEALEAVK